MRCVRLRINLMRCSKVKSFASAEVKLKEVIIASFKGFGSLTLTQFALTQHQMSPNFPDSVTGRKFDEPMFHWEKKAAITEIFEKIEKNYGAG